MRAMTSKQRAKWQRMKAKGKRRFMLERAFAFGLGCALAVITREAFRGGAGGVNWLRLLAEFGFGVVLPALFAAYGASLYWERNERKESA